jgi:hypothetical protein
VTEGFDRIRATISEERLGDTVSHGKDVETGIAHHDQVETNVFCDIHGRTCENCTAPEITGSNGEMDEWV